MSVLTQTLIVFLIIQVFFGFLIYKQVGADIFSALAELIKPKYLIPSVVLSIVFLIANFALRLFGRLFS